MYLIPTILLRTLPLLLLLLFNTFSVEAQSRHEKKLQKDLSKHGKDPTKYVLDKIHKHDLLVFDDGFHHAEEPFLFYEELVRNPEFSKNLDFIFIEVFHTDAQESLDLFFDAPSKEFSILYEVFQHDYSGYGWPYESYINLLSTIWDVKHQIHEISRLKVIAVSPPIYWEAIQSKKDYDRFLKTLDTRDYFMYHTILMQMENFKKGKKGIFLTNTRHAYKIIYNQSGEPYWNTNAFFDHFYPEKTFSIRFHHLFLSVVKKKEVIQEHNTSEGLENFEFSFIQAANGLWEKAFCKNQGLKVGLDFKHTAFGRTPYLGNHSLNIQKNTLMSDAYDGLIFLAPVEKIGKSRRTVFFITESFKLELKRRIEILQGDNLQEFLNASNVTSLGDWINIFAKGPKEDLN